MRGGDNMLTSGWWMRLGWNRTGWEGIQDTVEWGGSCVGMGLGGMVLGSVWGTVVAWVGYGRPDTRTCRFDGESHTLAWPSLFPATP